MCHMCSPCELTVAPPKPWFNDLRRPCRRRCVPTCACTFSCSPRHAIPLDLCAVSTKPSNGLVFELNNKTFVHISLHALNWCNLFSSCEENHMRNWCFPINQACTSFSAVTTSWSSPAASSVSCISANRHGNVALCTPCGTLHRRAVAINIILLYFYTPPPSNCL